MRSKLIGVLLAAVVLLLCGTLTAVYADTARMAGATAAALPAQGVGTAALSAQEDGRGAGLAQGQSQVRAQAQDEPCNGPCRRDQPYEEPCNGPCRREEVRSRPRP